MENENIAEEQIESQLKNVTYASFFSRTVARIIDFIIVIALYEIIPGIGYFVSLAYLVMADGLFEGKSIGKRLLGLKVLVVSDDETTIPCGYKESIFRNLPFGAGFLLFGVLKVIPILGWLVSFVIMAVVIVFESLVIVGNERGMRLGDEIAKTLVVEEAEEG